MHRLFKKRSTLPNYEYNAVVTQSRVGTKALLASCLRFLSLAKYLLGSSLLEQTVLASTEDDGDQRGLGDCKVRCGDGNARRRWCGFVRIGKDMTAERGIRTPAGCPTGNPMKGSVLIRSLYDPPLESSSLDRSDISAQNLWGFAQIYMPVSSVWSTLMFLVYAITIDPG
ncbi:hypothetical protein O181_001867 [Austropuccinia psidii MF-1]|uniref:Uncharacterized protein n=1 Tax=Austropuccinia psidii MF-1 TaxID=1389203 RepID=A0A9Q3BBP7_9BASI|nr:hypothetical protein [Austropuccinia psidii MF-1]